MTTREISISNKPLSIETGKLAKQADGAVIVRYGDSVVLVTACRAASPREGIDFLPLTVDYREYTYASGRIPGGFFKREGKPAEKEVLTCRVIDRPIRPLFPSGWRYETQIIALVLSADTENDTDVLAITGASAALALSGIPFQKTIAGVRVGLVDGQYVVNPTFEQRKQSKLDLIVAGSKDGLVMVEAGAKEVSEAAGRRGAERRARGHQADRRRHRRPREGGRPEEGRRREEGNRGGLLQRDRRQGARPADRGDADSRQARKLRDGGAHAQEPGVGAARRRSREEVRRQGDLQGAEGKGPARRGADAPRAARRPEVRRGSPDLDRDRRPPAHARVGRVHARRNAGARHLHARHGRRCAEDRDASRARRGRASCSTTTSRPSRSAKWGACRARDAAKSATARSPSAR